MLIRAVQIFGFLRLTGGRSQVRPVSASGCRVGGTGRGALDVEPGVFALHFTGRLLIVLTRLVLSIPIECVSILVIVLNVVWIFILIVLIILISTLISILIFVLSYTLNFGL